MSSHFDLIQNGCWWPASRPSWHCSQVDRRKPTGESGPLVFSKSFCLSIGWVRGGERDREDLFIYSFLCWLYPMDIEYSNHRKTIPGALHRFSYVITTNRKRWYFFIDFAHWANSWRDIDGIFCFSLQSENTCRKSFRIVHNFSLCKTK